MNKADKFKFIDWIATVSEYGYTDQKLKAKDLVIVKCPTCNSPRRISFGSMRKSHNRIFSGLCSVCARKITWASNTTYRNKQSAKQRKKMLEVWNRPDYKNNQSIKHITATKQLWQDQEYRDKVVFGLKENYQNNPELALKLTTPMLTLTARAKSKAAMDIVRKNPGYNKKLSESSKKCWRNKLYREKMQLAQSTPEYKVKASAAAKKLWQSPTYAKAILNNTSSKQEDMFAEFLDNNHIEYQRQFLVGPWSFDFFLPQYGVLVEINGDYFHKQPKQIAKDASKATYLSEYHQQYILKVIWEHEFLTAGRIQQFISELILSETHINNTQIDFQFGDTIIKPCDAPSCISFFSRYHYTANGGRNGINIACYLNDIIIACARFCNPTRAESSARLGLTQRELKELTRFAIHPSYQQKNFASWFLSRCIKMLSKNKTIKCLLTFADRTHNHDGTIYRASNWICDGITPPDYYYVDIDGFVMHKRTLWGHAKKMCMSEQEYAINFGYSKRLGKNKVRYLYWLES